jgi:D-alanine-D-alanine ligase
MAEDQVIAVLMGGPGSEREVSLASGRAVLKALLGAGKNAVGVEVSGREIALPAGTSMVFNVIHGTFGEDGELQAKLEALGVPYTGAGVASSRLAFDKCASKERFLAAGVPTPRSETVDVSSGLQLPVMSAPLVVKPPCEGSSVGVHIVMDAAGIEPAMRDAARFGNQVLVEQFVAGKELTVGILADAALPVIHIAPRGGFYDMNNKYPWMGGGGGTDYHCPADLDEATTLRVQQAALAAHRALGVEVYSRVDVLLDPSGAPYVLEVNTIPGMTESSLLPKAAAAAGYDFAQLCQIIAQLSQEVRSHV